MCGIVGCVGGRHARAVLDAAVDRMAHRGPDDRGVRRLEHGETEVWLGFRRLAIIDPVARGNQPMSDAREELWIVFNGEIYNYRELRRELEAKGHRFRTGTDTEVILYAYREWGTDALPRLAGQFAFGLWDARTGALLLARDRLGIKPLYYHRTAGQLAFASEVKALLVLPEVERRLNAAAAASYFNFLWVPQPATLFEGIRQLEPGTYAVYRDGRLEARRYWSVPLEAAPPRPEAEVVDELESLLADATRMRLVSDVPLGAFLSGGIDSSLIVALMRRAGAGPITTQTVVWSADEARYDIEHADAPYARIARDWFGDLDYHEVMIRPDVLELLPKMVWHLDDPVADPAAISTYLICRAAREHATVMLAGMGAEELFAGYGRHRATLLAERYRRLPGLLRRGLIEPLVERLPAARPGRLMTFARNAKKFVRSADMDFEDRYLGYVSYYDPEALAALMAPGYPADGVLDRHRAILAASRGGDRVQRMSHLDLETFLPNLNLAYTDRAGMAASVEVRVPMIDHRVVELVAGLPPELKIRGREQKHVLKRVAERYLPDDIVRRPKTGFQAPVRAWVQRDLKALIHETLSKDRLRRRGVLDPDAAWRVIDDVWSGREDNALRVWAFLTFELWAETFLDRDGSIPLAA